jgi:tetratricopeptide (TPR) repeat protein
MSSPARASRITTVVLMLLLGWSGLAGAQDVEQLADRDLARRRFDEGVMFGDRGDFTRALAAFQEAYRLEPHPIVLYNIGQAYQALDRPAEAVEHLQRYLDEVPDLPAERRAAVEQQISAVRLKVRPPPAPPPPRPAATVTIAVAPPVAPHPSRLGPALLAGGGAALVAGAVGLRLWNDGRYSSWQRQSNILSQRPEPTSTAQADTIDAERAASNARLGQIRRTDNVVWGLAVAGAAAVAGGALWWWSHRPARADGRAGAERGPSGW